MDLFSALTRKRKIAVCCIFIGLTVLLIVSFAVALIFERGWKSIVYLVAIIVLSGVLAWTLKGGMMEGNINKKGVSLKLCDGVYEEGAELPETYIIVPIKNEKVR